MIRNLIFGHNVSIQKFKAFFIWLHYSNSNTSTNQTIDNDTDIIRDYFQ